MSLLTAAPTRVVHALGSLLLLFTQPSCSDDEDFEGDAWRPDILLISVDTLRADHLGCYGYERATSAFIDAMAASGIVFDNCFATAPNTAPSHMSLMTSLYPTAHAVPNSRAAPDKRVAMLQLPDGTVPLAELLRMHGYQTAAYADGGNVSAFFGFGRGFDVFESKYEGVTAKVDQALNWVERAGNRDAPFFLFLHTYQVHEPYLPPDDLVGLFTGDYDGWIKEFCFDERGRVRSTDMLGFSEIFRQRERITAADTEYLKALYDAEIVHTDRELRRLWQGLKRRGLSEDLLVIFVADHGEEFGEHGDFGHKQMYDEVTRVPFIVWGRLPHGVPGARRVADQVSLLDVMPTLLDILSIEPPPYLQGRSIAERLRDQPLPERPVFAELIDYTDQPRETMMRSPHQKLMRTRSGFRLYDLVADALETTNLNAGRGKLPVELREAHAQWIQRNQAMRRHHGARETGRREVPTDELKQLGY